MEQKLAIGLMSGTSLDGIDAALIRSDGQQAVEPLAFLSWDYEEGMRDRLRAALGPEQPPKDLVQDFTDLHAEAVEALLIESAVPRKNLSVVGFHGQTLFHDPARGITVQMGDGALLAELVGIPVVNDFRSADVAAGGQGAPFAPLYHAARAAALDKPMAVLNLGGVGNVTWIGPGPEEILAFDTGPGNALIDDWVLSKSGKAFDKDGELASLGPVNEAQLAKLLNHLYFSLPAPKSLDRGDFTLPHLESMGLEEGAATLAAFTVAAVAEGFKVFPAPPQALFVCGGGRKNKTLMAGLSEKLECPVAAVEAIGWNGDALEAEAFAYLALRSLEGLPLSLPGTTGVSQPLTGGQHHRP